MCNNKKAYFKLLYSSQLLCLNMFQEQTLNIYFTSAQIGSHS